MGREAGAREVVEHYSGRVIMRRVQILPGRAAVGLAEHRAFVEAMRAGDPERAEQLRRENIRSAIRTLRRFQAFIL